MSSETGRRSRRQESLHAAGVLASAFIIGGLATVWLGGSAEAAAEGSCATPAASPTYTAGEPVTTLKPADSRAAKPPPILFGTSRNPKHLAAYEFTVTGPAPDPVNLAWQVTLIDGNRAFPEDQVTVQFVNDVKGLAVRLCMDAHDVPAGTYTGALVFAGGGTAPTQLPLTVGVKDNDIALVVGGMLVVSVGAVFVKWWTIKIADTGAGNKPSFKEFGKWLGSQWVTVVLAVVTAAGGIYYRKYYLADAFVPSDRVGLYGATFTAVISAALLLNSIGLAASARFGNGPQRPAH
jgi:hypothetical protein